MGWLVLCLVTIFVTIAVFRKVKKIGYRFPPGPAPWPFFGNILQLYSTPMETHHKYSKTYGDIHSVSLFGHKVVVLNSIEALKDCNVGNSDVFMHRPVWLENTTKSLGPGIAFRGFDQYLENRKFLLTNLKKRGMGKSQLEPTVNAEADLLLSYLEKNSPVNPLHAFQSFSFNMVSQVCFERRSEYGDEDSDKFIAAMDNILELSEVLFMVDYFPLLNLLPQIKSKSMENVRNIAIIQNSIKKLIEEKQNNSYGTPEDECDIVDDYIKTHKEFSIEKSKNLVELCHDLYFGGVDTSSSTTAFAVIHLLNNPEIQDELFEQITDVLQGRDPSLSDLKNLPIVEATIQETLRMNPIVPLIWKATAQTAPLREYLIPKDTLVLVNAYSINRDEKYFKDPFRFNAHRWINEDGKFNGDMVDKIATFGRGRRQCPGIALARLEIFIVLVKIIQNYELSVAPGHQVPDGTHKGRTGLIQPEPFLLSVKKRKS